MDCISEDQTEDSISPSPSSSHHSPPSPRVGGLRRSSLDAGTTNKQLLNYRKTSTPIPRTTGMLANALCEMPERQRRMGIGSAAHPRVVAAMQDHRRLSVENSTVATFHHLRRRNSDQLPSTSVSSNSAVLSQQLQMPTFSQQNSTTQDTDRTGEQSVSQAPMLSLPNGQCHPEASYTNGLNGYNAQMHQFHNHLPPGHMNGGVQNQQVSVQAMLSHVSSVLSLCRIPFLLNERVFTIEHQGVQLQIVISSDITIQIQYLAGDTVQYQRVCAHLYTQLQRYNYAVPPQRACATTFVS